MHEYRDLRVWRRARQLVVRTYEVTAAMPRSERFGMTSQLRRSACSIAANLAEGAGRGTDPDFRRFVQIASGSAFEHEAHLTMALDVGLIAESTAHDLLREVDTIKRMLAGLTTALDPKPSQAPRG